MSRFEPNKRHFWEPLIYFFNLKKSAAEAHWLLVERYMLEDAELEALLGQYSCQTQEE